MTGRIAAIQSRFDIKDLFFTRTDGRGVIEAGNAVFQRVSHYDWDRLIGAPHRIIRHPDMPKGVFHLLWDTIQAGKPIGAYVQNLSQDEQPYWVFATVLPWEDGYVSVRLKPSCGHLDRIAPLYDALRAREVAGELTPEESAAEIVESVRGLGYADYEEFMSFALRDEVAARESALKRVPAAMPDSLVGMFRDIRHLEQQAGRVEATFNNTHQIPYNMRLQAGRLEASDGPISVISGNHRQMTQTLEEHMTRFSQDSAVGAEVVRLALFKTSVAHLVEELARVYATEDAASPGDKPAELARLGALADRYREQSVQEVRSLSDRVRRFGQQCRDMRRMMSGLELTRIMCKIERSKIDGDHAGLDEIVNRLADAQASLGKNFDQILQAVGDILQRSDAMQRAAQNDAKAAVA